MRTDRELTALFADAIVDESADPTFLDELFDVLLNEVESVGLAPRSPERNTMDTSPRLKRLGRPGMRAGGRALTWPLALAAAIVLAVVTGAVVLRPNLGTGPAGVSSASPAPSATPGPTWKVVPASSFATFTSSAYGYSIGYPSNWKTHESPGRLDPASYPYDFSGGVDYLSATSPDVLDPGVIIAGPRLTATTSLSAWMAEIAQLQATNIGCGKPDATEPATVAGLPAQIDTWQACPEYILWAGFVRDGAAYHVLLIDEFATENPPLQAADKAMFVRMLGTFGFTGPAQPIASSPAATAPASS
jgi:hypothetical protein